jgi:hypothetical protein
MKNIQKIIKIRKGAKEGKGIIEGLETKIIGELKLFGDLYNLYCIESEEEEEKFFSYAEKAEQYKNCRGDLEYCFRVSIINI